MQIDGESQVLTRENFHPEEKVKVFCTLLIPPYISELLATPSDSYQPKRANGSRMYRLLPLTGCVHPQKDSSYMWGRKAHGLPLSPEVLASSRRGAAQSPHQGQDFSLPPLSCTCPCFCECSVCTCFSFSRKFIDRNITLMLKSNTLTDVLESKEECTIFQNYCAYLLILSFASDIRLGKCLKTFVFLILTRGYVY